MEVWFINRAKKTSEPRVYDTLNINRFRGVELFSHPRSDPSHIIAEKHEHKIKKTDEVDELVIRLTKNPDILASVSHHERAPFCVGFAAETQNIEEYAMGKLERKKLNMICANRVCGDSNTGFNADTNELHTYWAHGKKHFPSMPKTRLARELMQLITEHLDA